MNHRVALGIISFSLVAAVAAPRPALAQAQSTGGPQVTTTAPTTLALLRDIAQVEKKLIGLAEAIPEEKYGWRPAEGVRSVGEMLMHVVADNYFIPVIGGFNAPAATGIKAGDFKSVQAYEARKATKAETVLALRESFTHLRQSMGGTDQAFLDKRMNVFGTEMSGMDLWVLTTTHLHEHLGQGIAYARSNGVAPPWSR